jgi:hypothetical protein
MEKTLNNSFGAKDAKIKNRFALVDNVKGVLVLLFLASHIWSIDLFSSFIPSWMLHKGNIAETPFWSFVNFSLMDLGPTAFFFVIGLTIFKAFSSRVEKDGKKAALHHYVYRNVLVLSGAFCLTFIRGRSEPYWRDGWDNIHSIAFTGLLLIPFVYINFIRNNAWLRLLLGAALLTLFYIYKDKIDVLSGNSGGMAGCVGYAGLVLVVSFVGDMSRKGALPYLLTSAGIVAAAFLANKYLGRASYVEYNTTYMIMSLFVLNIIYFVFYVVDKLFIKNRPIPVLAALGRSLLLFFILSWIIAIATDALLGKIIAADQAPLRTLVVIEALCALLYFIVGFVFDKKKIVVKI